MREVTGSLVLSFTLIAVCGCGGETDTTPAGPATSPTAATAEPAESKPLDTNVELTEAEIVKIKELPAEEAEIALNQKVCPVGGGHLGAMGVPVKVTADGKTAFLCCEGCQSEFEADPAAALAKLGLK